MLLSAVLPLAADPDPAGTGGGPLGLIVILLLGVATVLLIRSMRTRLTKLPPSFDPPPGEDERPSPPSDGPSDGPR